MTATVFLEMPAEGAARTVNAPGILSTSDGTENLPAVLGARCILPSNVSYYDGFYFPTQVLARGVPAEGKGETTAFAEEWVIQAGELSLRTSFEEYAARRVCHLPRRCPPRRGLDGRGGAAHAPRGLD